MPESLDTFLQTAKDAVRIHATTIVAAFRAGHSQTSIKTDTSIVTEVDRSSERAMRALISMRHPDHAILGEEDGESNNELGTAKYRWVLDPIDGTSNFANTIPLFVVAAALMQGGEVIVSALYQPLTDQLWWASEGQGAYLNGSRLSIQEPPRLKQALVSLTHTRNLRSNFLQVMATLGPVMGAPRVFGSGLYSMAQFATGNVNAHVGLTPHIYDIAAGLLIAQEAGATAVQFSGLPWKPDAEELILAHPDLVDEIVQAVSTAKQGV